MANRLLFGTTTMGRISYPATNTVNNAGGIAYKLGDKATLAQLAATGCMNNTYYVKGEDQLDQVLALAQKVDPIFVAKVAVYARQAGFMKDMPALLLAYLSTKDTNLLRRIWPSVIDNGKMLRNFVQIMRSGRVGRKSLGTAPKNLVKSWFEHHSDDQVFRASVGNDPSLAEVIKMVHPKPSNDARRSLYGYLIGKEHGFDALPKVVQEFEVFKKTLAGEIPNVDFQMLTALPLTTKHWKQLAEKMSWTQTRMNLNTMLRHEVFKDPNMVKLIADRLRDKHAILKSKVFPYQLMTAFLNAEYGMPGAITMALQDAMEIATENTPKIEGKVYVFPDVSGSMGSPVTGYRGSVTTTTRCIDIAALVAACILRKNPDAEVIPFEQDVVSIKLNPRDSIMTNAQKLASVGGGGTNCSASISYLNKRGLKGELLLYISDNESWVNNGDGYYHGQGTATMKEFNTFKTHSPKAKMVCIDITPNTTTQAPDRDDILNVGGFSDVVFDVAAQFSRSSGNQHWVDMIENIVL